MNGRTINVTNRGYKNYTILLAKNQKLIKIHRIKQGINYKANYEALSMLSPYAYKLYMYLMMHDNDRIWALSSKDVYARTKLTEKTYPIAVKELIENKYLVASEIDVGSEIITENAYNFYEHPLLQYKRTRKDYF